MAMSTQQLELMLTELRETRLRWVYVGGPFGGSFEAGWSNSGDASFPNKEIDAAFAKQPNGLVVLKGQVKKTITSSLGTIEPIFFLPEGFRPAGDINYIADKSTVPSTYATIVVGKTGRVHYQVNADAEGLVHVWLNAISFVAER